MKGVGMLLSVAGALVWSLGAFGSSAGVLSVDCRGEVSSGQVTVKVVVTNLTDKMLDVSLSGTILDHAAGKESLTAGVKGVNGNDCNALNARNAAAGGVVISGYKAKLKPRGARTIAISETVESPKPSPASYDINLTLYDANGPCDSRTVSFAFEKAQEKTVSDARNFSLVNIFPYSSGHEDRVAQDMEAYAERSGESHVLYCLSFHPEGNPAREKADQLLASYRKVRASLKNRGICLGVLVQSVLGHWPRHDEFSEDWERTQNLCGTTPRYCPDGFEFRDYITYFVTALARESPSFILCDDDIHFKDECFCRHHVEKFNKRMGTAYDAKELRAAIVASKPDDLTWLSFFKIQRESMSGLCAHIRAAIDSVDPTIPAGICMSGSEYRFVGDLAKALAAKGQRPWIRIANTGNYEEYSGLDFSTFSTRSLLFVNVYPSCDLFDESDTFPHNLWNRSSSCMNAKLLTAQMAGLRGGLLWYVGAHKGNVAMADEYLRVLERTRGLRKALSAAVEGTELEGVAVLASTNFPAWHIRSTSENPNAREDFLPVANWGRNCGGMFGVPYRVTTSPDDASAVCALSGRRIVERLSDAELRKVFSARVLLDGEAALAVADRGYAEWLGVTPSRRKVVCTREVFADGSLTLPFLPDAPQTETPFFETPVAGAKMISWLEYEPFEGAKTVRRVAPGAVSFVNGLGGRVVSVAYPVNLDASPSQGAYWSHSLHFSRFSEVRKRWFEHVLSEAYGAELPVAAAEDRDIYLLSRRASDGSRLLLLVNQNRDSLEGVRLRFARQPILIERLTDGGEWNELRVTSKGNVLNLGLTLSCYEVLIVRVRYV